MKKLTEFLQLIATLPLWVQCFGFVSTLSVATFLFLVTVYLPKVEIEVLSTGNQKPVGEFWVSFEGVKNFHLVSGSDGVISRRFPLGTFVVKIDSSNYRLAEESIAVEITRKTVHKNIFLIDIAPYSNPEDDTTREVGLAGVTARFVDGGKVALRTIVWSIAGPAEVQPLDNLTIGNFTIQETQGDRIKYPDILSVTPRRHPIRLILGIDTSESMWGTIEELDEGAGEKHAKRRIEAVTEAAVVLVDRLTEVLGAEAAEGGSQMAILPFGGNSEDLNVRSFVQAPASPSIWFSLDAMNAQFLGGRLQEFRPAGATPLWDAVKLALSQFSESDEAYYDVMIFLTDGKDQGSDTDARSVLALVRREEQNVPIFTLAYGPESTTDVEDLANLSRESGAGETGIGTFVNLKADELDPIFGSLANGLVRGYEITWQPAVDYGGKSVQAELTVRYHSKTGPLEAHATVPRLTR